MSLEEDTTSNLIRFVLIKITIIYWIEYAYNVCRTFVILNRQMTDILQGSTNINLILCAFW